MLAVLRFDVELLFAGVGDEILVLHGGAESVTQHLQPVCRQVRRRHEWPADALPGIEELQRLLLLGVAREVDNVWRPVKIDRWFDAAIKQYVDLLGGDPVRALADDAVEALADAVDLVALHRQEHVGRRREARDQLELGAEDAVERLRVGVGAGAGAGIADDELAFLKLLESLHLGACHRDTNICLQRWRAKPSHPERVETGAGSTGEWPERSVARYDAEHCAVLRRDGIDVIGSIEAAAARHVLGHHVRGPRQVLAEMASHHTAPRVIAAAGPEPDDHGHVLAGEVWALRGGGCQHDACWAEQSQYGDGDRGGLEHRFLSPGRLFV